MYVPPSGAHSARLKVLGLDCAAIFQPKLSIRNARNAHSQTAVRFASR